MAKSATNTLDIDKNTAIPEEFPIVRSDKLRKNVNKNRRYLLRRQLNLNPKCSGFLTATKILHCKALAASFEITCKPLSFQHFVSTFKNNIFLVRT